MADNILHIVNGDAALSSVQALELEGEYLIWREMLCDGPTKKHLLDPAFESVRTQFLKTYYHQNLDQYKENFIAPINQLKSLDHTTQIILWFEDDLFCHINMLAAIQLLADVGLDQHIDLVCVGSKQQKTTGLSEVTKETLEKFYKKRVSLTLDDVEHACLVWSVYGENNHMKIKTLAEKKSNFSYLPALLLLHLKRFPGATTGLNALEKEILNMVDHQKITSKKEWLKTALQLPNKYGFGDMQLEKIIDKLTQFTTKKNNTFILNENGLKVKNKTHNFYRNMKDDLMFGGTEKYQFLYVPDQEKLMKL